MRINLVTPFKDLGGQLRTFVEVREVMTGGDILFARRTSASKDPVELSFMIAARMCGLDMSELESMDVRDIEAVQDYVNGLQSKKADATP
jgi:hypothetical protein